MSSAGEQAGARRRPSRRSHITIIEVAASAGVSKSTVSNVVRGDARVGPEIRERVQRAIDELGYRPSAVARSLVQRRTRSVGAVVPDLGNPFYADILKGAEDHLRRAGYSLLISSSEQARGQALPAIEALLERRVDGFLFCVAPGDAPARELLASVGAPAVLVDQEVSGIGAVVTIDDNLGLRLAVRHLVELGHRRIAAVIDSDASERTERLAGYRAGLAEAGIAHDPALEIRDRRPPGSREPAPRPAVAELVVARGATAIVAGDDLAAIGIIDSLEARGLVVPTDVSVVGFDDIAFARIGRVALTTVRQPTMSMGAIAADILVDHLEERSDTALADIRVLLEPELVVRRTTGPPP